MMRRKHSRTVVNAKMRDIEGGGVVGMMCGGRSVGGGMNVVGSTGVPNGGSSEWP